MLLSNRISLLLALFCLPVVALCQDIIPVTVPQYDDRIEVTMRYDRSTRVNKPQLNLSDEYKYTNQRIYITIRNKTQGKIVVHLEYYGEKTCGITTRSVGVSDVNGVGILAPGQSKNHDFSVSLGDLGDKPCNPTKQADGTYSYIREVGYKLNRIVEEKASSTPASQVKTSGTGSSTTSTAEKLTADKSKQEGPGSSSANNKTQQSKTGNGATTKTAEDDFWSDNPKQKTTATNAEAKKAADQKAVDNMMTGIKKDQEASNQVYKDIDKRADLQRQGFAAVGAREEARNNVKELSTLSGSYQSVEQLMADFNQKMAQLNSAVSDLTARKNQALNSSADAFFNTPDVAAYGAGIKAVGALVNGAKEAKERKKAQEELKAQKEYMLNNMLAEEKRLLTGIRTDLFSRFKEGSLPLSSSKLEANTIYYFVYAYDPAQVGAKTPTLYVSNIFQVARYSDGSWPFKTSLTNEIAKLTPYAEVLHGYYTNPNEAVAMRDGLQKVFGQSGGRIAAITYKGKKAATTAASGSTDFWETGKKAPTDSTSKEKKMVKKDNFWNN